MKSVLENSRKSDITFWRDGHIDICARVSRALDLREGDVIDIAIDEGFAREYYLYAKKKREGRNGRHKATCRAVNGNRSRYMRVNSKQLTRFVLHTTGEMERARVMCGEVTDTPMGKAMVIILKG
ncbi:MAG: hypothetical protein IKT00_06145 [Prevotella sp.]|nr:hypothetical protein [Prevotella sp.]